MRQLCHVSGAAPDAQSLVSILRGGYYRTDEAGWRGVKGRSINEAWRVGRIRSLGGRGAVFTLAQFVYELVFYFVSREYTVTLVSTRAHHFQNTTSCCCCCCKRIQASLRNFSKGRDGLKKVLPASDNNRVVLAGVFHPCSTDPAYGLRKDSALFCRSFCARLSFQVSVRYPEAGFTRKCASTESLKRCDVRLAFLSSRISRSRGTVFLFFSGSAWRPFVGCSPRVFFILLLRCLRCCDLSKT